MTDSPVFRVLIAHQSTIPHFRVPFYELLERKRPPRWSFDVVYDTAESKTPRLFLEPVDHTCFGFPILDARTTILAAKGHRLIWQHFFWAARTYDVVITDTHMTDITYPLSCVYQLSGRKHVFWGHIRNMNMQEMGRIRKAGQSFKLWLIKRGNLFFAYTQRTGQEAAELGVPENRIVVLNNTIDIAAERAAYASLVAQRDSLRQQFHVSNKRVLLYVGRLYKGKRIEFLLKAFAQLYASDQTYHLIIIGGGEDEELVKEYQKSIGPDAISAFGPISGRERLAPIFVASDLYVLPGAVGLAPLQALSYDLPVIAFDVKTHGPEFEYLNSDNAVILPEATTPEEFAVSLPGIFEAFSTEDRRAQLFASIEHLTLEGMVDRFIEGVNRLCP